MTQESTAAGAGRDAEQARVQEREALEMRRRRLLGEVAAIERLLGIKPRRVRCRECGSVVDTRARHSGRG